MHSADRHRVQLNGEVAQLAACSTRDKSTTEQCKLQIQMELSSSQEVLHQPPHDVIAVFGASLADKHHPSRILVPRGKFRGVMLPGF